MKNLLHYTNTPDSVWAGFTWMKAGITCSYKTILEVLEQPQTDKFKEKISAFWYFENEEDSTDYLSFWLYKQEIPKNTDKAVLLSVDVNSLDNLNQLMELFKKDEHFSYSIEDDLEKTILVKNKEDKQDNNQPKPKV